MDTEAERLLAENRPRLPMPAELKKHYTCGCQYDLPSGKKCRRCTRRDRLWDKYYHDDWCFQYTLAERRKIARYHAERQRRATDALFKVTKSWYGKWIDPLP